MRFKRLISAFLSLFLLLGQTFPAYALSPSTLRPERAGAEEIAAQLVPASAGAEEHLASYAKFQEWYGVHFIKVAEGAEAAKAPEGPYLATALWDRWRALDEVTRLLRSEKRPSWLSTDRQKVIDLLQGNIKGIAKAYQLHYMMVSGRDVPQRKSEDEITGLLDRSPADAVWMDLLGRSLSAEKARNLAFPKQGQGVVDSILEVQPVKDKVGPVRIVIYKPDAHIQGLVQMPGLGERGDHLYQLGAKAHPASGASSAIASARSRADQRKRDDARKGGASSQDSSAATGALLEAELGKELLEPIIRVVADELPAVRRRWANHPNKDKWPLKAVVNFLTARLRRPADEIEAALAKAVNIRPGQPFAEEADVIALLAEIRALPNLQLQIKGLAPKPAAERIFPFIDRREPLDGDFGRALQRIMAHVLKEPQAKDVQFAKALWLELEKQNPPPPPPSLEDILLAGHPENYHIPRLRWRNLPDRATAKQKTMELLAARYQQTEQKISNALGRAEVVPAHFAFVTHNDAGAAAKLLIAHFEQHAEAMQRPGGEIALEILRQVDGGIRPEDRMGKSLLGILQQGAEYLQQGKEKAELPDVLWRAAPETLVQGRGTKLKNGGYLYTRNAEVFQIVQIERESEGRKLAIIGRAVVDGQPRAPGHRFTPERLFSEGWRYNPPDDTTKAGAEEPPFRMTSIPIRSGRNFINNPVIFYRVEDLLSHTPEEIRRSFQRATGTVFLYAQTGDAIEEYLRRKPALPQPVHLLRVPVADEEMALELIQSRLTNAHVTLFGIAVLDSFVNVEGDTGVPFPSWSDRSQKLIIASNVTVPAGQLSLQEYQAHAAKELSGGPSLSASRVLAQLDPPGAFPELNSGTRISLVARIGDDPAGQELKKSLTQHGVDVSGMIVTPGVPTATTLALVLPEGRTVFNHIRGASDRLQAADAEAAMDPQGVLFGIHGAELSLSFMPEALPLLRRVKAAGQIVTWDTVVDPLEHWGKFSEEDFREVLSLIDVFIPSIGEARAIIQRRRKLLDDDAAKLTPQEIVQFFLDNGSRAVFLKLGKDGSLIRTTKESIFGREITLHMPVVTPQASASFPPALKDETGMGDAYAGAVIKGILMDWPVPKIALTATATAYLVGTEYGGTLGQNNLANVLMLARQLESQPDVKQALAMAVPNAPNETVWLDSTEGMSVLERLLPSGSSSYLVFLENAPAQTGSPSVPLLHEVVRKVSAEELFRQLDETQPRIFLVEPGTGRLVLYQSGENLELWREHSQQLQRIYPHGSVEQLLHGPTAGAEEVRIIEEKKPTLDPELWGGLSIQKKTVVLEGGLGSLGERFLRDGLNELRQATPFDVDVIAVDRWDPDDPNLESWVQTPEGKQFVQDRLAKTSKAEPPSGTELLPWVRQQIREFIQQRRQAIGLPFIAYFPLRVFQEAVRDDGTVMVDGRSVKVDGVIPAVYTRDHLSLAEPWIKRGVPVWLDKPIVRIDETGRLRQLAGEHPRTAMGVDFFMYSDALLWLLSDNRLEKLLPGIGTIQRINGRCCEPWGLENEKRSWLMVPELSGGTGLGIDTVVHPLAMIEPVLQEIGRLQNRPLSLKDAQVTGVRRGRYVDSARQSVPGTGETYFWMEGSVGDIPLYVDGGKGVDTYYYGITIMGTQGSIEVFVGTGEYDPYVRITRADGSVELHTFPGGSLGYRNIWLDFLLLLHGSEHAVGGDLATRLDAMTGAVDLIGKAERYAERERITPVEHLKGQAPEVPLKVLGQVSPGLPKRSVSTDLFQRTGTVSAGAEEVGRKLVDYMTALHIVEQASAPVRAGYRFGATVIGGGASQDEWKRLGERRWWLALALKGAGFDTPGKINDEFLRLVAERQVTLSVAERGFVWGAAVGAFNSTAGAEEWSWFWGPVASERLPDLLTTIQHKRALEEPAGATSPLFLSVFLNTATIVFATDRRHARENTPELAEARSAIVKLLREGGVRFQPGEKWVATPLGPVMVADGSEAGETEGFAVSFSPFDPEALENEVPEPWEWGSGAYESLGIYLDRLGSLYSVLGGTTVLEVIGPADQRFKVTLRDKASQRRVNASLKRMTELLERILPPDVPAAVVSDREISRDNRGRRITLTLGNAGVEETVVKRAAAFAGLPKLTEWFRTQPDPEFAPATPSTTGVVVDLSQGVDEALAALYLPKDLPVLVNSNALARALEIATKRSLEGRRIFVTDGTDYAVQLNRVVGLYRGVESVRVFSTRPREQVQAALDVGGRDIPVYAEGNRTLEQLMRDVGAVFNDGLRNFLNRARQAADFSRYL